MRHAKKPEFILDLEKVQPDPFEEILKPKAIKARSRATLYEDKLKVISLTKALRESDKLIRNLVTEGAIAEESIFTRQVLKENKKALKPIRE